MFFTHPGFEDEQSDSDEENKHRWYTKAGAGPSAAKPAGTRRSSSKAAGGSSSSSGPVPPVPPSFSSSAYRCGEGVDTTTGVCAVAKSYPVFESKVCLFVTDCVGVRMVV